MPKAAKSTGTLHACSSFPSDSAGCDYFQTNEYTWADGRKERFEFPATYTNKRIWWDTERIEGQAWEIDDSSIVLTWRRKDIKDSSLYEMIQLSEDGNKRARTWHWFENGELVKRTLIKEERVQ